MSDDALWILCQVPVTNHTTIEIDDERTGKCLGLAISLLL